MPNYSKDKSFLKDIKWVQDLYKDNNMENAVKHAKKVIKLKNDNPKNKLFPFTKLHLEISEFEKKNN